MNSHTRTHIKSIARAVRSWAEEKDNRRKYPTMNLNGWCAIASAELSRRLAADGYHHEIMLSECEDGCHVFVVVDDYIVDVTATQFGPFIDVPVVFQHHKELQQYWFYQPVRWFESAEVLRKYQRREGWPRDQIAYRD